MLRSMTLRTMSEAKVGPIHLRLYKGAHFARALAEYNETWWLNHHVWFAMSPEKLELKLWRVGCLINRRFK